MTPIYWPNYAGDVVAIEMKYHLKCLISLYNRAKVMAADVSPLGRSAKENFFFLEDSL